MVDVAEHGGPGEARTWKIRGMDCASCVAKVEKAVSKLSGVTDIQVNLMSETLTARLGPSADPMAVVSAVGALGYLTGTTGLWLAILADTGATVLVTINALRLLGWRSPVGSGAGTPPGAPGRQAEPLAAPSTITIGATA